MLKSFRSSRSPATSALLSTSDPSDSRWRSRQDALIASPQQQPLLVVVRPDEQDLDGWNDDGSLLDQLRVLQVMLMHEVAWRDHHLWPSFIQGCATAARIGDRCSVGC